jgi:hypothetical protein
LGITFSPQNILDITRRELNILTENVNFNSAITQLTGLQSQLLNVDAANTQYYNSFTQLVYDYEAEITAINGTQPATYTDGTISPYTPGDLSTSANTPAQAGATFFPQTYTYFIPELIPALNGINNPVGTTSSELSVLQNPLIISYKYSS